MFCYQCEMSAPSGCGSKGQSRGTCGKGENVARLQDTMIFGLKGLAQLCEIDSHKVGLKVQRSLAILILVSVMTVMVQYRSPLH
ncbi:MAG: hypothetical protein GY799_28620 [Desulfobulbaceae bacterium]|nr:hypothetical protein [Desulfobulbaceae bacterium]